MTIKLTNAIFNQDGIFNQYEKAQAETMKAVKKRKQEKHDNSLKELKETMQPDMMKLIELATEKGASCWLTSIPLKKCGFRLNKQQWYDSISIRYDRLPNEIPKKCCCGKDFSVSHSLTCKKGGFVHMRHDAVRDTFADLMEEFGKDVRKEPALLPVSGEILPEGSNIKDGARSDISALSIWSPLCKAFFDVRVFNPLATTNWTKDLKKMYTTHENEKKKEYNQRILQIEKGTFTPLVFSCSGGAGPEAVSLIKHLASLIRDKKQEPYSKVISVIRRRIRFDILRSCNLSLRGFRGKNVVEPLTELDYELCNFRDQV